MPFIARCLKTNKRSNRHANLGNPGSIRLGYAAGKYATFLLDVEATLFSVLPICWNCAGNNRLENHILLVSSLVASGGGRACLERCKPIKTALTLADQSPRLSRTTNPISIKGLLF
jgi:hypothetical protein